MNDTTLQLTVERFRAIASADIRLDEITVLAGINASGKSTLAHLFHSLINLNAIYPTSLESYYWEKLSRTVDATEELRWQIDHPGESRSATDRYSGRIFKPQLHVKSFETLLSEFDRFLISFLPFVKILPRLGKKGNIIAHRRLQLHSSRFSHPHLPAG